MSFSARLGSTNSHRRPPFHRPQHAPTRPSFAVEDAQPNELLGNRSTGGAPPAVRATVPAPRRIWKSTARGGGGTRLRPHPLSGSIKGRGKHAACSSGDLQSRTPFSLSTPTSGPSLAEVRQPCTSSGIGSVSNVQRTSQSTLSSIPFTDPAPLNTAERPVSQTARLDGHPTLPIRGVMRISSDAHTSPSPSQKPLRRWRRVQSQATARTGISQELIKPAESSRSVIRTMRPDKSPDKPTAKINTTLRPSQSSANASDFLLNDLGMPASTESPPSKRRKVTCIHVPPASAPTEPLRSDTNPILPIPQSCSQPAMLPVKRERSLSPVLDAGPRLVKQGCVRIAPLPPTCRKTHLGYPAARQQLAKAEMDKLRNLGLQPIRVFTREDGMVVDWKSDVPVFSDTLLAPTVEQLREREEGLARRDEECDVSHAGATEQSHGEEDHSGADVQEEVIVQSHLLPAPSPARQVADTTPRLLVAQNPPLPDAERPPTGTPRRSSPYLSNHSCAPVNVVNLTTSSDTESINTPASSGAVLPISFSSRTTAEPLPCSKSASSDSSEVDDMESAALDFLKKYMITFSEDRAILARAYSRMARLSIIAPSDAVLASRSRSRVHPMPFHGRADIVSGLLALPDEQPLYDEAGEGMAEVDWDLVYVEDTGDVLLICYATHDRSAGAPGEKKKDKGKGRADRWTYEQRFLLRRREWDTEDRDTPGLWPLVAVSHQMTIKPLFDL